MRFIALLRGINAGKERRVEMKKLKSHLNKIISHKLYQFMTVRNVNTARYLAGDKSGK